MKLLVFAHYNEAASFIQNLNLKKEKGFQYRFYSDEDHDKDSSNREGFNRDEQNKDRQGHGKGLALLLTGENFPEVLLRVTQFLTEYGGEVDKIINMGVCASVNGEATKGEIFKIRCVYGFSRKPFFHSFETVDKESLYDCVSFDDRLQNDEMAKMLSYYAPLVDRELWAVSYAASRFRKPVASYKIVSDQGQTAMKPEEVLEMAEEYSARLYVFFLKEEEKQEMKDREEKKNGCLSPKKDPKNRRGIPPFLEEHCYFTSTQRKQMEKYLLLLERTRPVDFPTLWQEEAVKNILTLKTSPKKRTISLLKYFEDVLNPLKQQFEKEISILFRSLEKSNITYKHQFFGKTLLNVSFDAKDEQDWTQKIEVLKKIDFKRYQDYMKGNFFWGPPEGL